MFLFTLCICVGLNITIVRGVVRDILWGRPRVKRLGKKTKLLVIRGGSAVATPRLEV